MNYEICPKCGIKYNVSRLRDKSKVFVCQDCESHDKGKLRHQKQRPIYDKQGLARVVFFMLLLPLLLGCAKADNSIPLESELQAHIVNICEVYKVEPAVVFGIIERESRFDVDAMGDGGNSYGLMQINAQYHRERMAKLGVTNLNCAYCNVLVGIDYLAELIEEYGDENKALVAYNAGRTGAYNGWFSVGRYESDYSRDVMANAAKYSNMEVTNEQK